MIRSFTIDELFLEVEQCSKYDVVLPKHIAIAVLAKLRAADDHTLKIKEGARVLTREQVAEVLDYYYRDKETIQEINDKLFG